MPVYRERRVQDEQCRCSVCGGAKILHEPFHYLWRDRRWDIVRCSSCTHGFVYPFVAREEQEAIYDDTYFDADGDWVESFWDVGYVEAEPQLRAEAGEVLDIIGKNHGRLLEIGCAGGFFLDEARRRGFDAHGIEPNVSMAKRAREELGVDVACGWVEDLPDDTFTEPHDVLVLMDVLEHIPQPQRVFRKAAQWLSPDATVLIRGPLHNDRIAMAKEAIRRVIWVEKTLPGYPLDSNLFNRRSLGCLLQQIGVRAPKYVGEARGFSNVVGRRTPHV